MKPVLFCLVLLSGCKPAAYFISPNQVQKEKVVLFLRNQSKIPGEINIHFENDFNAHLEAKPSIDFLREGKKETEVIRLADIVGYSMGPDFFALKRIDLRVNYIYGLLFVKRLTGENSKIQLYELYESGRGNDTGEGQYSYYLSLPSFAPLETLNTISNGLLPYFDQKMSKIVSDCPSLAEKIRSKEKGYFLSQVSFATKKHPEVLLRIINEYNNCN